MKLYDENDIKALTEAIDMSATSINEKLLGGPFGAVIYKDGKCIAKGCNHVLADNDPSAHAEVYTIRKACQNIGSWDLSGAILYTSCEPCPMCLMTAKWANISKIYFAATRKDAAAIGFRDDALYAMLKDKVYGIAIEECRNKAVEVMNKWYETYSKEGNY